VFADQQEPPAYAASLRQQLEEDARVAAKEVAKKTRRIDELVASLQVTHEDHMQRVQSAASGPDLTGDLLQQISTLQASLPSNESGEDDELPFFHVPQALVDQWVLDIEELEVALGSPFHPSSSSSPQPLDDTAAQQVCTILTGWLRLLESESGEMSFVHKLLLAKKLLCVDQLRPSVEEEENPPYQLLELRALLLRLSATDSMWSFALRLLPVSFFAKSQRKMQRQSAAFYVKAAAAAAAAAPADVLQRVRLLVEQCRVLDSGGQLRKAKRLLSVDLDYPQAPIDVLYALHKQYPAAGPAFDFSLLEQFDEEASAWQQETAEMNRNATALEQAALLARKGEAEGDPAAAAEAEAEAREARAAVTERERHPPRGGFIQCMQKSRLFFHTDKRLHDTSASDEDKAAQFARCNEAWDQLSACRSRFQELRQFRARMTEQ